VVAPGAELDHQGDHEDQERPTVVRKYPSLRVCEKTSPAVSPRVVAAIFMIQKASVTSGSFFITYRLSPGASRFVRIFVDSNVEHSCPVVRGGRRRMAGDRVT
jgi:hypothetical protein